MSIPGLAVVGERIDRGFKSTRAMFDAEDFGAIQDLAIKQRDAGAVYLNVNIGPRAKDDAKFVTAVVEAIQAAVDLPLAFDYPGAEVQEVFLKTYDIEKAGGGKPMINSISECRRDMFELLEIQPCKIILMASERLEDGAAKQNKTAAEKVSTCRRMAKMLLGGDYGVAPDDVIVDVAINALSSDTEGLTKSTLETVRQLGGDPALKGIHMMGALSNLSAQLPSKEVAGTPLKLGLESAFLTLAVPHGFDMVLGAPWRKYGLLSGDNVVFQAFGEIVALDGLDALRRLRKLYA